MSNPVAAVTEGATNLVKKPMAWARATPVIFLLFVFAVALLVLRFRTRLAAWLAKYKFGRWVLGAAAALPLIFATGLGALSALRLVALGAVFLMVGDAPAPVTLEAAYLRPSCVLLVGDRVRCYAEGFATPVGVLAGKAVRS